MTFIETHKGVVSSPHDLPYSSLLQQTVCNKAFRHLDSSSPLLNIILCSLDGHALMDQLAPFLVFCFGTLRGVKF